MSILKSLKSVPEGLKPQECERTKLRESPPVFYVPTKDEVQEEVAKLRNLEIKTTIEKDTTLNFPVWHESGTREAFLMHVMAVLDAIKKHGHFQDYEKAEKVHEEAKKAIESARAALSLLDGFRMKAKKVCKKKAREAAEKALAKALDSESEAKEAKEASEVNDNSMKVANVLRKPLRINVCQFVWRVEQLNAYIAQMPCFYYNPNANASTKLENVLFMVAELGAHVLHMCPLQWQDQYNMNKKGMTPMDMRLLLTSLEAIECVCTYEKGELDTFEKSDKSSNNGDKGKKCPGTNSTVRVPKKVRFEKH
jgi:hypothetical protein